MGMFWTAPPNFGRVPEPHVAPVVDSQEDRDRRYFVGFVQSLRTFFDRINSVQQINIAKLNINIDTLPTEADLADLRVGDIYQDTTASNVLKVKT